MTPPRLDARSMTMTMADAAPVTAPPPDAGDMKPTPPASTPDAASSGAGGSGGSGDPGGTPTETKSVKGGCGCELGSAPGPAPLVALGLLALVFRRRRR